MKRNQWLFIIAFACSFVRFSSVVNASMYEGEWQGTTDQGYNISFAVSDNGIASVTLKFEFCSSTEEATITGNLATISEDYFTVSYKVFNSNTFQFDTRTVSGTFASRGVCQGTWYAYSSSCHDSITGTWTANKEAEEEFPWELFYPAIMGKNRLSPPHPSPQH